MTTEGDRKAIARQVAEHAEHPADNLDAPWAIEELRKQQAYLREIDVCGAMWECENGNCPCAALGEKA